MDIHSLSARVATSTSPIITRTIHLYHVSCFPTTNLESINGISVYQFCLQNLRLHTPEPRQWWPHNLAAWSNKYQTQGSARQSMTKSRQRWQKLANDKRLLATLLRKMSTRAGPSSIISLSAWLACKSLPKCALTPSTVLAWLQSVRFVSSAHLKEVFKFLCLTIILISSYS